MLAAGLADWEKSCGIVGLRARAKLGYIPRNMAAPKTKLLNEIKITQNHVLFNFLS